MKTKKPKLSKTRQVLAGMLKENTGRSLCDSGGTPQFDANGKYVTSEHGYGRAFERNQGVNFEAQPESRWDITVFEKDGEEKVEIGVIHSVYHWLADRLHFDGRMQRRFDRFAAKPENSEKHWLSLIEEFPLYLRERGEHVAGLYGDEADEFNATYTYNNENMLSQDIQFVYFEVDDEPYVLLQIHGGCDARGGLTAPKVFRVDSHHHTDGSCMFFSGDGYVNGHRPEDDPERDQMYLPGMEGAKRPDRISWHTENGGYRWSFEDEGWGDQPNFEEFPRTTDQSLRGKGYVVVDKEKGKVYCPVTGWELVPHWL